MEQSEKWLLEDEVKEYEKDPEFVAEGLALKITEEILQYLEEKKLSQSWLAEQMGVSRAHISRVLNARPNMTLLTIAKIALALGLKPYVCLESRPADSSIATGDFQNDSEDLISIPLGRSSR